jgi:hypothetical protein
MDKIMELLVPAETMPSKVKGVFYGPHLGTWQSNMDLESKKDEWVW